MAIYHLTKPNVNDVPAGGTPSPVSGNLLSHNRYDPIGRAFLAADLYRGARTLHKPTLVQAAWLSRINRTYAFWADKRYAQRAAIEAGLLPLVPPVTAKPVPFITTDDTIPDVVLADVIRKAGITRTIDIAAQLEAAE
jgi:hypothetical protein